MAWNIHLGEIIKEKAVERGLTQQQLADKIGCSRQNVGNIFKRKAPKMGLLLKMCEVLEFDFLGIFRQEFRWPGTQNYEIDRLEAQLAATERRIQHLEIIAVTQGLAGGEN